MKIIFKNILLFYISNINKYNNICILNKQELEKPYKNKFFYNIINLFNSKKNKRNKND